MENDSENLTGLGERNFRCVLVKSNASSKDINYHLMVVFNHSVGDGTSGLILANQIFTLYDEAVQNSEILQENTNAEIVKTWREAIQPEIPNGNENYKVSRSLEAFQGPKALVKSDVGDIVMSVTSKW